MFALGVDQRQPLMGVQVVEGQAPRKILRFAERRQRRLGQQHRGRSGVCDGGAAPQE